MEPKADSSMQNYWPLTPFFPLMCISTQSHSHTLGKEVLQPNSTMLTKMPLPMFGTYPYTPFMYLSKFILKCCYYTCLKYFIWHLIPFTPTLYVEKVVPQVPFMFFLTLNLCPPVLDSPTHGKGFQKFTLSILLMILYSSIRLPLNLLCSEEWGPSLPNHSL